jgi:hypothetical protein
MILTNNTARRLLNSHIGNICLHTHFSHIIYVWPDDILFQNMQPLIIVEKYL